MNHACRFEQFSETWWLNRKFWSKRPSHYKTVVAAKRIIHGWVKKESRYRSSTHTWSNTVRTPCTQLLKFIEANIHCTVEFSGKLHRKDIILDLKNGLRKLFCLLSAFSLGFDVKIKLLIPPASETCPEMGYFAVSVPYYEFHTCKSIELPWTRGLLLQSQLQNQFVVESMNLCRVWALAVRCFENYRVHLKNVRPRPEGEMWFSCTNKNTIIRLDLWLA